MNDAEGLAQVVRNVDEMVEASVLRGGLPDRDLRALLVFVSQVIQVVGQSFDEVVGILVDVSLLDPEDLQNQEQMTDLRRRVGLLTARSHYRDAAEICSRLQHLKERFEQSVRPKVAHLPEFSGWAGVFGLIDEREGRIIQLVEQTARELESALARLDASNLVATRAVAQQRKNELQRLLSELHRLNGRILGYSGHVGFLELTTTNRKELERVVHIMVDKSVTHGHRVEVGAGANISGNFIVATTIQDAFKTIQGGAAAPNLKAELERLCKEVDVLMPHVPEPKRADVQQDLTALVQEASKEKPRQKWYELSADGLLEAAKACGDLAAPVIATVTKIVALLAA
jgi:hypothetical protein